MSVVWRTSRVALLDHREFNQAILKESAEDDPNRNPIQYKDELFNVQECYLTPSASAKRQPNKRKHNEDDITSCELEANKRHEEVVEYLQADLSSLQASTAATRYFQDYARRVADVPKWDGYDIKKLGVGDQLAQMSSLAAQCFSGSSGNYSATSNTAGCDDDTEEQECKQLVLGGGRDHSTAVQDCLFDTHVQHACPHSCLVDVRLGRFILPQRSSFVMSDASSIQSLLLLGKKFDLLVMDPPWENKSASRSNRYSTMPIWEIGRVPVAGLTSPHALVAIWITNRRQLIKKTMDSLLPKWQLHLLAEWHWLKVTASAVPVIPFSSSHKRSYETLLLCRRCCCSAFKLQQCCGRQCLDMQIESATSSKGQSSAELVDMQIEAVDLYSDQADAQPPAKKPFARAAGSVSLENCVANRDASMGMHASDSVKRSEHCSAVEPATPFPSNREVSNCQGMTQDEKPKSQVCHQSVGDGQVALDASTCPDGLIVLSNECSGDVTVCVKEASAANASQGGHACQPQNEDLPEQAEVVPVTREDGTSPVPQHLTLISIPSKVHSHKPPLADVLKSYLPAEPSCIELFARSLTPGWTSWGNEVLLLQHADFFQSSGSEE